MMEPKNHPIDKEKSFSKCPFWGSNLIFQGVDKWMAFPPVFSGCFPGSALAGPGPRNVIIGLFKRGTWKAHLGGSFGYRKRWGGGPCDWFCNSSCKRNGWLISEGVSRAIFCDGRQWWDTMLVSNMFGFSPLMTKQFYLTLWKIGLEQAPGNSDLVFILTWYYLWILTVCYDHIEIMKSKSSLQTLAKPGAASGWVRCESSSLEDGNGCGAAGASVRMCSWCVWWSIQFKFNQYDCCICCTPFHVVNLCTHHI